ncbi:MAG: CHAP domain-containing protein [Verrucomicrobiota bacterium]
MKRSLLLLNTAALLGCLLFTIQHIFGDEKAKGASAEPAKIEEIPSPEKAKVVPAEPVKVGDVVATYRTIPVYSNGDKYTLSYGKNFSDKQYYFGQKWQCVEFVKRFYHDAFNHRMPSVWGNAVGYYDPTVVHGKMNQDRGMFQFKNGGASSPQPDDLLVFDMAPYGHVSVITAVRENEIEVVQQNIAGKPRQTYVLDKKDGLFSIVAKNKPIGWLRLPPAKLKNPVFPVEPDPTPAITPAP